uniref:NADH-ubiquinone oxidoreductase chain 2 n=1 Tax=Synallactes sp. Y30071 TaxID=2777204 RepID=A0A7M1CF88_9ECHN|nr:NADH dehydrogenase subunit 2 [Synallactes sp. Y30071]
MNRIIILILILSLFTGTLLVITSNHWFPVWLGLELSTLSIIPLLNIQNNSRNIEATLKYFLVQAFSAAVLLNGATLNLWITNNWEINSINTPLCHLIITIALIIKIGLAPCHFWFPDVISGLPFLNGLIIACWQKIAPIFLLLSITSFINSELLIICATLSVFVGGWGGLNQVSIRKILAYSSISHLGWITCTAFFIPEISLLIFIFYILNNTTIFLICHNNGLFSLSSMSKSNINPTIMVLFSLSLLSLGGLPPLGGFLNKIIPLSVFTLNQNTLIIPFFLFGSLLSLYFYLRIVFNTSLTLFPQNSLNTLILRTNNNNNINTFISLLFPLTIWGLLLIPLFFIFI